MFLSGRGSTISSAPEGRSGYIRDNMVIRFLSRADVRAFYENRGRKIN